VEVGVDPRILNLDTKRTIEHDAACVSERGSGCEMKNVCPTQQSNPDFQIIQPITYSLNLVNELP